MYHETTGASVALLRYHDFVPKGYLDFGMMLLRNGVDRRDVAGATVASLKAALASRFSLFRTVVHTDHHLPAEVKQNFAQLGLAWCEAQVPGAKELMAKYQLSLPNDVEQHDLSEAKEKLGWTPTIGFTEFLRDLQQRDARGEEIARLWAPGQLPPL